ncbi:Lsr2 family protein [Microbacterium sp. ISL-103]|nr:Lsr2 family protein [Microbacterium sp. ISL-103]
MAQRQIVELIDDLDQTLITDGGTYTFALNGKVYEIDLSSENIDRLNEALAPFIASARPVRGSTARDRSHVSHEMSAIRAWAQRRGYTVSDRGRIPSDVIAAYRAG